VSGRYRGLIRRTSRGFLGKEQTARRERGWGLGQVCWGAHEPAVISTCPPVWIEGGPFCANTLSTPGNVRAKAATFRLPQVFNQHQIASTLIDLIEQQPASV
jgi:hypothetical protein